ncbi:MAG: Fic family protein [Candidatus Dormibacteraeota bacterium]|uniref:Fic family protein n=1 Tax=Candidatus Amunia macphersoniae TaxID=3127014 RepID=A0A934KLK6_9BACT|nr:Fic family protein [Candidatus Dormibacteraeota bacterium]
MSQLSFPDPAVIFQAAPPDTREQEVIGRVEALRTRLRQLTGQRGRWVGTLRRVSLARAIRGSNSIEGYIVSLDDAVAVADGEDPLDAAEETAAAVRGYRDAMTYIVQLSDDANFSYDESLLRSLHFMMTQYDLRNRPGLYRLGAIYVRDDSSGETVYEGPPGQDVRSLMLALTRALATADASEPAIVRAAMAHLNLVMIHPFKDGNGRMARALQTLVLARDGVLESPFCSVEEYLGHNTQTYYRVLAEVGGGTWQPQRDSRQWVRFMLTAHLRQAMTLLRRADDYERLWDRLSELIARNDLPERTITALSDAAMGFRVTNAIYRSHDEIGTDTASRDLRQMVERGLLQAVGERRGRHYVGSGRLRDVWRAIRSQRRVDDQVDPFAG